MKRILLILVLITAALLFSYKITDVPPGINGDEAGLAYNAYLISKTGHDESGRFLPLFIEPKTADWSQPVMVYSTAILFKVLGPSFVLLREVSVIYILLSIVVLYFLSKEFGGIKFFVAALIVFITTPIIMIQSHLALENIYPVPFVLLWLLFLFRYEKSKKVKNLIFCALSLGVALFTYYAMRIVVPTLILITVVYLYRQGRALKYFLVSLIPFAAVLFVSKFYYPGAIIGSYKPGGAFSLYDFFYRYLSAFDFSFLFFNGDRTPYHSTGSYGMLLIGSLPLFAIGMINAIRSRDKRLGLILVSFLLVPLFYGLVPDVHRASRLLSIVPFYVLIAGYGATQILASKYVLKKYLVLGVVLIAITVNYYQFVKDYWNEYPLRVQSDFSSPLHTAFAVARENLKKGNGVGFCVEEGIYNKDITASLFFREVYLPNYYPNFCGQVSALPAGVIAIVNPDALSTIDKVGLDPLSSQIGFYRVYIKR